MRERGSSIEVLAASEDGDAERFAAESARSGAAVVASGGDGTLQRVVNGVLAAGRPAPCPIGVLPLGTASDFAAGCGIPTNDAVGALLLIVEGVPTPIDVALLGARAFVNVASGGFGAQVTAETPPELKRVLGTAAYVLTGLGHVTDLRARHARLVAPGFVWEGEFYAFAVGNGRQAGGGFQICPRALLDDGLLDVVLIPNMPHAHLLALLGDLRRGSHLDDERIVYRRVSHLTVETDEELQVNLDGEPSHGETVRFQVLRRRRLPFYLPPGAPLMPGEVRGTRDGTVERVALGLNHHRRPHHVKGASP